MPLLRIVREYDTDRMTSEELRVARGIVNAGSRTKRQQSLDRLLDRRNVLSTEDDGVVTSVEALIVD